MLQHFWKGEILEIISKSISNVTRTEFWPQEALWVFYPNFATCKRQLVISEILTPPRTLLHQCNDKIEWSLGL